MVEVEVVKYRPIKLIAVIFTGIALLLLIIGVAAADWVDVKFVSVKDGWRSWGLWEECYDVTSSLTACVKKDWMSACAALTLLSVFGAVGALGLGIFGLCTHKRVLYIIAGVLTAVGALFILISVIIFPVKFSEDISEAHRSDLERYDIDWTYGVTLGGLFFLLGASIFFFIKQEDQEVSREKTSMPAYYNNSY
ncbi:p53 apoptosis effector related to PMP-22-like isoform X2 [Haliotis cracherodii]|uniref:p53 apoptosis effector related to PMP-22-like isoform X2 n=1 Tax=Haliotis rufescens TaxID=6454 RepID=UPI001EAF9041|nr:p53 apoptosis effector related to PMP-22-like isoform X2 [Haliotis rufescens]